MLSFSCQPIISVNPSMHTSKLCNWNKATKAQSTQYSEHLNDALTIIDLSSPFLNCKYLSYTDGDHIDAIDNICDVVVKCCVFSRFAYLEKVIWDIILTLGGVLRGKIVYHD